MITLKEIESAFEAKFASDQNLEFRARARCNQLAGLWAAEKLALAGQEAEAYAKKLVMLDLEAPGRDAVFRKIRSDFGVKGVTQSDQQIRRALDEGLVVALADLKAGH